jgi:hypothetical protein
LDVALLIGLAVYAMYHRKNIFKLNYPLYWFILYMTALLLISYLGSFGGIGLLTFPFDLICMLPLSMMLLYLSQSLLQQEHHQEIIYEIDGYPDAVP